MIDRRALPTRCIPQPESLSSPSLPAGGDPSRVLARRYLAALLTIALLVVLDQAVVQPLLVRLNITAPVINVAGRQRMLSQRLAKAALALQACDYQSNHACSNGLRAEHRRELRDSLAQWTQAHHGLQHGDNAVGLPPSSSPEIDSAFQKITPHFDSIRQAAEQIATNDAENWQSETTAVAVTTILAHEAKYLPMMDQIVGLYERQAQRQVIWLRVIGLGIMLLVLLLILVLGWFVIRPATHMIECQIDELTTSRAHILNDRNELDERVRQRTRELQETNLSLKHEVDERQRAEQRTRQLSLQLAHASRVTAMGQLATGLAHELNQPLAAITNFAETAEWEMAQEQPRQDRVRDMVGMIRRSALRAGHLVRNMRNFVRPNESPRLPTDISEVIEEVCELCRPAVHRAGAELQVAVEPHLPAVAIDRIQIQQVLLNLIQNAVQALQDNDSSKRHVELTCQFEPNDRQLELAVSDTGPGFAQESSQDIFQPFYTTKADGLGVGLAICRSLVRQHGGELKAKNGPHGGARVVFTIPIAEIHERDLTQIEPHGVCR